MTIVERVVARLEELGFKIEGGGAEIRFFGEPLPFVRAVALDPLVHQLVFVAEENTSLDDEAAEAGWKELFFAVSGIRHHLRGGDAPAIATPIVVGVVTKSSAGLLRGLAERLAQDYALFSRMDLNLLESVGFDELNDGQATEVVDRALASALPNVRDALSDEVTVAGRDVEEFWDELDRQVVTAAEHLVDDFGEMRPADAVERVQRSLRGTVAPMRDSRPRPFCSLDLRSFRSFGGGASIPISPVTIVSGPNGSGKTSICEAMEILWSATSRRIPADIADDPETFERHLWHRGRPFEIVGRLSSGDEVHADGLARDPEMGLGRSVLPQEVVTTMADGSPKDRFGAFLEASGLQIPEFANELKKLRKDVREELDAVLGAAGLETSHAANETARTVIGRSFAADYLSALTGGSAIQGAAGALVAAADGAYLRDEFRFEPVLEQLASLLTEVDTAFGRIANGFDFSEDPGPAIEAAVAGLDAAVEALRSEEAPLRRLEGGLREQVADAPPPEVAQTVEEPSLDPRMAARWLGQVRSLEKEIIGLTALRQEVQDSDWQARLDRYLEALESAVASSSKSDLQAVIVAGRQIRPTVVSESSQSLPQELLLEAGFESSPAPSEALIAALGELRGQIAGHADALSAISRELAAHPGLEFADHAERIAVVLCRFELVREIAKPTGALSKARETLVLRLLDGRLFPIVRELVDALVRFEWYFEPMTVDLQRNRMKIGGLSNPDPDLDIRMMLNAAERSIVGVAWFLALYLTQPEEDRQVLVLDDVTGGFDESNKASFVATIRALARLAQPRQILITTHDPAFAAVLEQELAPVDGWPQAVGRLRCRRDADGNSAVIATQSHLGTDIERELEMIPVSAGEPG